MCSALPVQSLRERAAEVMSCSCCCVAQWCGHHPGLPPASDGGDLSSFLGGGMKTLGG